MRKSKQTSEPIEMEAFRDVSVRSLQRPPAVKQHRAEPYAKRELDNTEPVTPVRHTRIASSPAYERDNTAANESDSKMINDPSHQKAMTGMLQSMNKAYANWSKKKREFSLAVTKSKASKATNGSTLEVRLEEIITEGDAKYAKMQSIEQKYVLNQLIDQSEQLAVTTLIDKLSTLAKNGDKTKFCEGL